MADRIFVYEHVSAGQFLYARDIQDVAFGMSMLVEGLAMRSAVEEDFCRLGCDVFSLSLPDYATAGSVVVADAIDAEKQFDRLCAECDYTLLVAPETNGVLQHLAERASVRGRLLSPSAAAVACCSDKLSLARLLTQAKVATPATEPLEEVERLLADEPTRRGFPLIVKPIDGAGSDGCCRLDDEDALTDHASSGLIVQPFVAGRAVSVCALCAGDRFECLVAGDQRLDQSFTYLGGRMPLPESWRRRSYRLAGAGIRAVMECVGGLHGLIGVDLVLGADAKGRDDRLIEINPRLTTSYVGLRYLADTNLAEAMLRSADGQLIPVTLKEEAVEFSCDGIVRGCQAAT